MRGIYRDKEKRRIYVRDWARRWRAENPKRARDISRKSNQKRRVADPEGFKKRGLKYYRENLMRFYFYNLKYKYHLSQEQFKQIWGSQNGRCRICLEKLKKPYIDHDHACCPKKGESCGECIRGFLCCSCNIGLGGFRDNIKNLKSAIKYLNSGKGQ